MSRASTRTGSGAEHRCAMPGQGPARVTDWIGVPVDRSPSCRSQLLVVYLALPRHH